MLDIADYLAEASSRSLRGERGLKSALSVRQEEPSVSLPSRGAWIEIKKKAIKRGIDLESLPSRGAWIEILCRFLETVTTSVAPFAGSVD